MILTLDYKVHVIAKCVNGISRFLSLVRWNFGQSGHSAAHGAYSQIVS
jgi:hypothetical protein